MTGNSNERQRLDLLREIEEINERISEQNKAAATASGQELRDLESRIANEKIALRLNREQLEAVEDILEAQRRLNQEEEDRLERQEELNQLQEDYSSSFARLNRETQVLLNQSNNGNSTFQSISQRILEIKEQEITASEEERKILQQRRAILEGIRTEQIDAAEAATMAKNELFGINDAEIRRMEFQASIIGLTDEEKELALDTFNQKENLIQQQERYNQLSEAGAGIMGKLPAGLQSVIGFIKNMITGIRAFGLQAAIATAGLTLVIGAIVAGLDAFMELNKAGEDFRNETGVTNSMMADMESKALEINKQFAQYGVSIGDAYDTMAALRSEISEVANYSQAAVAGLTLMKTNFGVSAEEAAKVQGVLESVGGLSEDTAVNVQMQVANMSKLAGVAPKKVLKDIAENAEATSTFFKGDISLLAKQAVEARRLGTDLSAVTKTAEKLLDFENGIEEELVAATFVGGQFNLSRARALAMEGKLVEAQEETLKQIQRSGDFRKQDYFTQQQLAKAANMSVEEINKQLNAQEKLSRLSAEDKKRAEEAINAGLDITNLNDEQLMQEVEKAAKQREMASTMTDLENSFKGIVASVGGALIPLFEMLGPILKFALFPIKIAAQYIGFIIDGIMWVLKKIPFVSDIVEGLDKLTNVNIPTVGSLAGGAPSATAAGDVISPANGQTMISTKEGGLLKLSGNDDVVAAPGAASAIGGGANLSVLAAPLNAMIGEIKALRADLAAGKIAVNMDGVRVSSGIGRVVDGSTRNNFAMS